MLHKRLDLRAILHVELFIFFFQAEDGIRDYKVTGVQTCALPISLTTVLLIGFAPVAWVFSESTKSLPAIGALHLIFWLIATYFGLRFLHAGFAHIDRKSVV